VQIKAELNLLIIPSSVPVFEATTLNAGLNLFIITSSVPVFEAAKSWVSFHYS
jgi:hypothetical protein